MVARFVSPAELPLKTAQYSEDAPSASRRVPRIGSYPALATYCAAVGIVLDESDASVDAIDGQLSLFPPVDASELLRDVALYLGDALCSRVPEFSWTMDGAGYPQVRFSKAEVWDVVKFVHWREEGRSTTLREGLELAIDRAEMPGER